MPTPSQQAPFGHEEGLPIIALPPTISRQIPQTTLARSMFQNDRNPQDPTNHNQNRPISPQLSDITTVIRGI